MIVHTTKLVEQTEMDKMIDIKDAKLQFRVSESDEWSNRIIGMDLGSDPDSLIMPEVVFDKFSMHVSGTGTFMPESMDLLTSWRDNMDTQQRHWDGLEDLSADWGVSFYALSAGAGDTMDRAWPPIDLDGGLPFAAFRQFDGDWRNQSRDWVREQVQTLVSRWRK